MNVMVKLLLLSAPLIFSSFSAHSQEKKLSEGATRLFKSVNSALSVDDKEQIYTALGFRPSKDGTSFFYEEEDEEDLRFDATIYPMDMNKDGIEEIFLQYGNTFISGRAGTSAILFIKDKAGKYQRNLDFPGFAEILHSSNKGYSDLLIGGPGFEFPIWRWNGFQYARFKSVDDYRVRQMETTTLDEASGKYQLNLVFNHFR